MGAWYCAANYYTTTAATTAEAADEVAEALPAPAEAAAAQAPPAAAAPVAPPPPVAPAAAAAAGGRVASKMERELERLRRGNRSLGERHQGLAAIPAELYVPLPPSETPAASAAAARLDAVPDGVVRLEDELAKRNMGGGSPAAYRKKKRQNRREPLLIESSYDIDGDRGRPIDIKTEMNAAVCEALRRCDAGEDLASWLARDPRHILLVIDAPSLGSSAALQAAFPCLADSQQIIVPQYDLAHYVSTINTSMTGGYVGVRLQRLDQWLCSNATRGFSCRLFLADVESAFLVRFAVTAPGGVA